MSEQVPGLLSIVVGQQKRRWHQIVLSYFSLWKLVETSKVTDKGVTYSAFWLVAIREVTSEHHHVLHMETGRDNRGDDNRKCCHMFHILIWWQRRKWHSEHSIVFLCSQFQEIKVGAMESNFWWNSQPRHRRCSCSRLQTKGRKLASANMKSTKKWCSKQTTATYVMLHGKMQERWLFEQ